MTSAILPAARRLTNTSRSGLATVARRVLPSPWMQVACGAALGLVAASSLLQILQHHSPESGNPVISETIVASQSAVPVTSTSISDVDAAALREATAADTIATIDAAELMAAPGAATARVARFRYDLRAFAADLMATGWVSPLRARYISYWAVTEAYRQGVPPALVLAVMSVEDDSYKSQARSNAGAVGLMQIMPRVWLSSLGPTYGWNLENDRTNVAMGIHVLAENLRSQHGDWYHALLRYNGCVHGSRTPTCFSYPLLVQHALLRRARWSCPGANFNACVERPLDDAFRPASQPGMTE